MGSGRRGSANRLAQQGAVPDPVILELRYRPAEGVSDRSPAATDPQDEMRADLARQLNASIYKAARSFDHREDEELTFVCACGCMAEVKRSLQEYVTRGAIVTGHARPAGHPSDPHDG
jgi:hypothetical protein